MDKSINFENIINNIPELNNFILNKNKEEQIKFFSSILNLGFQSYKLLYNSNQNISINLKSDDILNNINNKIETITENTNNISLLFNKNNYNKSVYGENIIQKNIEQFFPNYILTDTSIIPHNADFNLLFTDIKENILIESKCYSNTVDKNNIDKFIFDLNYTKIKYGIFISLNSSISNCKYDIEWKINKDNIIIFVSNATKNIQYIVFAIIILKQFILLNNSNTDSINKINNIHFNNFTTNAYNNMLNEINNLYYLNNSIQIINNSIESIQNDVNKQLNNLLYLISNFNNKFNKQINNIQNIISSEFKSIINSIEYIDLDNIQYNLSLYKNNKQIFEILNIIITDFSFKFNFKFIINDNKWTILNQTDLKIGIIHILKKHINISLENGIEIKKINIDNWNKIKNINF